MRKNHFIFQLSLVCSFTIFFISGCDLGPQNPGPSQIPFKSDQENDLKVITYTKHARCRMECREVSEAEVKEILSEGRINPNKSDPNDKPCPTEAVEGKSQDGQQLRIVVARCDGTDKIITVIDLENEYSCDCN